MFHLVNRKFQAVALSLLLVLGFMAQGVQAQSIRVYLDPPRKENGWVFTNGYGEGNVTFSKMTITITLYQKYGGRWHVVAHRTGDLRGYVSRIGFNVKTGVRCTDAPTPYTFISYIRVVGTRFNAPPVVGEQMWGAELTC